MEIWKRHQTSFIEQKWRTKGTPMKFFFVWTDLFAVPWFIFDTTQTSLRNTKSRFSRYGIIRLCTRSCQVSFLPFKASAGNIWYHRLLVSKSSQIFASPNMVWLVRLLQIHFISSGNSILTMTSVSFKMLLYTCDLVKHSLRNATHGLDLSTRNRDGFEFK